MAHFSSFCTRFVCTFKVVCFINTHFYFSLFKGYSSAAFARQDSWRLCPPSIRHWRHQASEDWRNYGSGSNKLIRFNFFISTFHSLCHLWQGEVEKMLRLCQVFKIRHLETEFHIFHIELKVLFSLILQIWQR